jgi:hypothetical protein
LGQCIVPIFKGQDVKVDIVILLLPFLLLLPLLLLLLLLLQSALQPLVGFGPLYDFDSDPLRWERYNIPKRRLPDKQSGETTQKSECLNQSAPEV